MRTFKTMLGLAALAGAAGLAQAQTTFYLHLLHSNDGESQIVNAGPLGLADFGGIARFATVVANLRSQAQGYPPGPEAKGSILISSGDNFLAGPEFSRNLELLPSERYFDSIGLQLVGFDAITLGNHEFDFGPPVLRRFITSFTNTTPFLSANLDFSSEPALADLVGTRLFKSRVITINTTTGTEQIGVIGATTENLSFISSPGAVLVGGVAAAVNAEALTLTAQGVSKIILSSHLQGLTAEAALIPMLRNVDAVIGGGGSELLANPGTPIVPTSVGGEAIFTTNIGGTGYPRVIVDADGRQVPLVTTDGDYKYVGRLVLGFDAAGNVTTFNDPISGPVRVSGIGADAVQPEATIKLQVSDPIEAHLQTLAARPIGTREAALEGRRSQIRSVETNLGNLCADALLYTLNSRAAQFGLPVADVGLQNGGGIRNNSVLQPGAFTRLDTFSVMAFFNLVAVVPNVPADQFKRILENAVANVAGTPGGGSDDGRFLQISGFRVLWNSQGSRQTLAGTTDPVTGVSTFTVVNSGSRVREVILNDGRVIVRDGQVVPGAPSVNIATIDFSARGGDQFPYNGAPFSILPITYQQALDVYITEHLQGQISARRYPAGGERRIVRVDLPLTVRVCRADYTLDGTRAVDDIFAYLSDFFRTAGGAGPADTDFNGTTGVDDLFAFLSLWFAGCD